MEDLYRLLPFVAVLLVFWLLVLRPAGRRQKEARALQERLVVGDKVLTNAGIFGTVARLEDDRVGLEVADGVVITVARPAVVAVLPAREESAPGADSGEPSPGEEG